MEVYGLIRLAVLRQTAGIASYAISDKVLLVELALRGVFAEVPEVLFFHGWHGENMYSQYPDVRDQHVWFNPGDRGRLVFSALAPAAGILAIVSSRAVALEGAGAVLWTSAALPVAVPWEAVQRSFDAGVEITDTVPANAAKNVESFLTSWYLQYAAAWPRPNCHAGGSSKTRAECARADRSFECDASGRPSRSTSPGKPSTIVDNYAAHKHPKVLEWAEPPSSLCLPLHPDLSLSSVKFSISNPLKGGRWFLSRQDFRQNGVNGIAGTVCKINCGPCGARPCDDGSL